MENIQLLKSIKFIHLKPTWYLSAAFIFIAVLGGILGQQQTTLPNQEIVLQFTNSDISSSDAQQAIAAVEKQLQRIGVVYIHVSEQEDGKMIISYYSDTTVAGIKKMLSNQKELAVGLVSHKKTETPIQFPTKDQSITYNLDVYEIKDGQNSVSDLGGKSAVELKSGQYRFVNPNFYMSSDDLWTAENDQILKIDFICQWVIAVGKDNRLHKIPEVRAGPFV